MAQPRGFGFQPVLRLGQGLVDARTLLGGDWADAVDVTFTPTAVFAQTPGPGAGNLIAGRR